MTSRTLDVAIVQAGELTEDLLGNLAGLAALVRAAAAPDDGTTPDLVVLPELITTPYFCTSHEVDRTSWAETIPGDATDLFAHSRENSDAPSPSVSSNVPPTTSPTTPSS